MANNHFKLTLDTIAPVGSITRAHEFIKANEALTIVKGDATYMKVWFTQTETGSTSDSAYTGAKWIAAADTFTTDFKADGQYYYHLQLQDDVANLSPIYNTELINFDSTAPVISNVVITAASGSTTITKERANKVTVTYSDTGATASGVDYLEITGNIVGTDGKMVVTNPTSGDAIDFTFADTAAEGPQTLTVIAYDRAGNASAPVSANITLDTKAATGTLHAKASKTATTDLPANVNNSAFVAHIALDATSTDVVGYKLWGDIVDHTTEPATYTSATKGADIFVESLNFTAADGDKVLHAKIIDEAGNETTLNTVTIKYDSTKPVVTLTTNKQYICGHDSAAGDAYNTATLTLKGSDATSGVNSWTLKVGTVQIDQGSAAVDKTLNITAASSLTADEFNTITLTVTDKAGNSNSASVEVYVDTQPAAISTSTLETWYNDGVKVDGGNPISAFTVDVTANDNGGSGIAKIEAWSDGNAATETVPSGTHEITNVTSGTAKTLTNSDIKWNLIESANNYLHIKVTDNVGNVSYKHVTFGYDSVSPTGSPSFGKTYYASTTATISLDELDSTSGTAFYKLTSQSSSLVGEPTGWQEWVATKTVTLSSTNGEKTVVVQYKDLAGNISDEYTIKTVLDTEVNTPTVTLFESDGTTPKANPSSTNTLKVKIEDENPGASPLQYKIYGDWSTSDGSTTKTTKDDVQWVDFTEPSIMLAGYSTTGDTDKEIYVVFKDAAGNESAPVMVGFTLDTEPPTCEITGETRARISTAHILIADQTEEAGKGDSSKTYGDVVRFTLTPNENIIAWKVCAYTTAADAMAATGETATPIGTTGGSVHMSGTGIDSKAAIECVVRGADYKKALGDPDDGAYYILAFVQDKSKTWSVAGTITA